MLVLSRKVGQELVIDGNIRITVNRIRGNRVTLGVVAPKTVRIVRGELGAEIRMFATDESEEEAEEPPSRSGRRWIRVTSDRFPELLRPTR